MPSTSSNWRTSSGPLSPSSPASGGGASLDPIPSFETTSSPPNPSQPQPQPQPTSLPQQPRGGGAFRRSHNWRDPASAGSSRTFRTGTNSSPGRHHRHGDHQNSGPTWARAKHRSIHPNFVSPSSTSSPLTPPPQPQPQTQPGGSTDTSPPPKDTPETTLAISQGRRIYVGNLLYSAKPSDIESLLSTRCNLPYERIHISIDPFTGRNPSYCFVEFPAKSVADEAMRVLSGKMMLGREVKCGPCVPKTRADRGETFRRWGDWTGGSEKSSIGGGGARGNGGGVSSRGGDDIHDKDIPATTTETTTGGGVNLTHTSKASSPTSASPHDVEALEDGGAPLVVASPTANTPSSLTGPRQTDSVTGGPYEALKHWENMADAKRRLYVGGLPRMADQRTCDAEVRALFSGFEVEAVSKAISPHNKENRDGGRGGLGGRMAVISSSGRGSGKLALIASSNSYYCFVDFPTAEEATRAVEKVNGRRVWGGRLRVAPAKGDSRKWREREEIGE